MYNRGLYNRTLYNTLLVEFTLRGLAEAISNSLGFITRRQFLSATGEALSEVLASIVRRVWLTGQATALSEVDAVIIRVRLLSGVAAEALAEVSTAKIEGYNRASIKLEGLRGFELSRTDVLKIDTDKMTVWINDTIVMGAISDDSVFFKLKPGKNEVSILGDTANIDFEISYKDRWI